MKIQSLLILSGLFILGSSCNNSVKTDLKDILPQYEISENKDTINYLDKNGMRQGHWIIYEVGPSNVNASVTHSPDSTNACDLNWQSCSGKTKTEEGYFKDNKKTGYWKRYFKNEIKDSVEFK